jgi:anti-sigma regulatory factor (Ser/Thr protein kinase)
MNDVETIECCFQLIGGEFANAGTASTELRTALVKLGVPQDIIRRAAVAAFEAEMNVIIHSVAGTMHYIVSSDEIKITITDMGPGIADIELAMQEGYSTAPEWARDLGWGAGMGLPNIKRNSNLFKIDSVLGEGTTLEIILYPKGKDDES